jgi:hypothetical protein
VAAGVSGSAGAEPGAGAGTFASVFEARLTEGAPGDEPADGSRPASEHVPGPERPAIDPEAWMFDSFAGREIQAALAGQVPTALPTFVAAGPVPTGPERGGAIPPGVGSGHPMGWNDVAGGGNAPPGPWQELDRLAATPDARGQLHVRASFQTSGALRAFARAESDAGGQASWPALPMTAARPAPGDAWPAASRPDADPLTPEQGLAIVRALAATRHADPTLRALDHRVAADAPTSAEAGDAVVPASEASRRPARAAAATDSRLEAERLIASALARPPGPDTQGAVPSVPNPDSAARALARSAIPAHRAFPAVPAPDGAVLAPPALGPDGQPPVRLTPDSGDGATTSERESARAGTFGPNSHTFPSARATGQPPLFALEESVTPLSSVATTVATNRGAGILARDQGAGLAAVPSDGPRGAIRHDLLDTGNAPASSLPHELRRLEARAAASPAPDAGAGPRDVPADLPSQIVQAIKLQWRDGTGEARLRLKPEHLGEILVTLQVNGHEVSASVQADHLGVRAWIETHADELRSMLDSQRLHLAHLSVGDHAREQRRREPRRRPEETTARTPERGATPAFEVQMVERL